MSNSGSCTTLLLRDRCGYGVLFYRVLWKDLEQEATQFQGRGYNLVPFFDSHTDMIHTLPFVVDYNMTMNRLNQMENPTQQPETSASYCTEIDLAENFRYDCSYFKQGMGR